MKKKPVRSSRKKSVFAHPPKFQWKTAVLWIVACELVGIIGSVFTTRSIATWYMLLIKPSFSPPNWVFGPVWTMLYALMGVSGYRIYRIGMRKKPVRDAIVFFGVQLLLNAIWSPVFFGAHNIPFAFAIIIAMWVSIIVTILRFNKLDDISALLLMPYLGWVSFATVLNFSLWMLNAG